MQVKPESMKINHRYGKGKNGRDSFEVTLLYMKRDVKEFLQRFLIELRMYQLPNKFTEEELIELFKTRLFELIPERYTQEMAVWAFDIALKWKYITTNRWDRESPTIYFIDKVILTLRRGRKGKGQVKLYEETKDKTE